MDTTRHHSCLGIHPRTIVSVNQSFPLVSDSTQIVLNACWSDRESVLGTCMVLCDRFGVHRQLFLCLAQPQPVHLVCAKLAGDIQLRSILQSQNRLPGLHITIFLDGICSDDGVDGRTDFGALEGQFCLVQVRLAQGQGAF